MQAWRVALVLCVLVTPAGSLMFDLPSGKVKCFSEDLPAHTMVVSADRVAGECDAEQPDARARPRYLHATVLPAGPERALLGVLLPGVARCDGVAPWQEGKFKADSVPEGQNRMPVEIQVTDPMEKLLFSKDDIEPESSSFAFTTSVAGDYIV
jgi:hypothetical protein